MFGSKKAFELIDRQPSLTNDGSERSTIQFWVIRYHHLREGLGATKNDVAAPLAPDDKSCTSQRLYTFSSRDAWQGAHTATSRASKRSGGTGRWSSSSAQIYSWIASRILEIASSRVLP
jgi:hypothetical protein